MNPFNDWRVEGKVRVDAERVPTPDKSDQAAADLIWQQTLSDGSTREHIIPCVGVGKMAEGMLAKWKQFTDVYVTGRATAVNGAPVKLLVEKFKIEG